MGPPLPQRPCARAVPVCAGNPTSHQGSPLRILEARHPPRTLDEYVAEQTSRKLDDGFFTSLTHAERSLYFFLVLAADRNGVSYYGQDRIASALELPLDDYLVLRNRVIEKDLVAFDGSRFQVLSFPAHPVVAHHAPLTQTDDFETHDPATVRAIIRSELGRR